MLCYTTQPHLHVLRYTTQPHLHVLRYSTQPHLHVLRYTTQPHLHERRSMAPCPAAGTRRRRCSQYHCALHYTTLHNFTSMREGPWFLAPQQVPDDAGVANTPVQTQGGVEGGTHIANVVQFLPDIAVTDLLFIHCWVQSCPSEWTLWQLQLVSY